MAATGEDSAMLALRRLLWLQRQTRRAVRGRQREAAMMLARVTVETTITGLYSLYEPDAVAELQAEHVRSWTPLVQFLADADFIPKAVLSECISRAELGPPARGPSIETMAQRVDTSMVGTVAMDLYKRFYRPASTFAVHGGAAALLLHVDDDDKLIRKPAPVGGRRSPARVADACLGALTAVVAQRAGGDNKLAVKYADKHAKRATPPIIAMALSRPWSIFLLRPSQLLAVWRQLKQAETYVQSGQDSDDPAARLTTVRASLEGLLAPFAAKVPAEVRELLLDTFAEIAVKGAEPSEPEEPVAG
jgi:hypothetical protein